jgi:glutathione S-transferase
MKLYFMPGACPLASHIVLEWIGAPYEARGVAHEELSTPAYRAMNPGGTVPMLEHGDFRLTENVAILGYLADMHPEAKLLGDGSPRDRAEVMRWVGFLNSDVHKAFMPIFNASNFLVEEALAGELADNARRHIRSYLERLDAQLEGRDWLTGTRSVADPYLFVILRWAAGKDVGLQGLDNLMRFARRMESDDAVRTAIDIEEGIAV